VNIKQLGDGSSDGSVILLEDRVLNNRSLIEYFDSGVLVLIKLTICYCDIGLNHRKLGFVEKDDFTV